MTVFSGGTRDDAGEHRVLVTGAAGFMGSHLVDLLSARWRGARIIATDLGHAPPHVTLALRSGSPAGEYVPADLSSASAAARLVWDHGPFRHVFHVAGLFDYAASYEDLKRVNVGATENLICALTGQETAPEHVVMWGAGGVYDFAEAPPAGADETTPIRPSAAYLETKYLGEMAALRLGKASGMPVAVIRPGGVYGPRARYGVGVAIMLAARGGMGPFFFGPKKNRAGTVHAQDVCLAGMFVARRPESTAYEIYNVNDDSSYTMYELFRAAARRLGFPMLPVALPLGVMEKFVAYLERRAAKKGLVSMVNADMVKLQAFDAMLDASKLKRLGWRPEHPDAMEGLMRTIDWYEREGWL